MAAQVGKLACCRHTANSPGAGGIRPSLIFYTNHFTAMAFKLKSTDHNKEKEITLPCGSVAVIKPGTGRDSAEAAKVADGNAGLMMPAIMARLVTIDGQAGVAEDFLDLPLADYLTLLNELGASFT